jgi:hypothetical protein
MSGRRYARFYYAEFMRDYPDVYGDDAAFAAFLRLLTAAEMAWPTTPEIPRSIRAKGLRILTERGLVKVTGHNFVLKGFVRERTQRSDSARNAAASRWHSDSNADADANAMPKKKREEEEEKAQHGVRPLDEPRALGLVKP